MTDEDPPAVRLTTRETPTTRRVARQTVGAE
jgi:hypothetical protein